MRASIPRLVAAVAIGMLMVLSAAVASAQGLPAPGGLAGRVIDQQSGRPVAGATVKVFDSTGAAVETVQVRSAGDFAIAGLQAGIYRVQVSAEGYRPAVEPNQRIIGAKTQIAGFELQPLREAIEEVVVLARALDTGQFGSVAGRVLNREEIRRAPGTAGDIFRGLNQLPGVLSTGEFSNFSVRGRGPRDNLILIDDIPYDRTVHFDQSLGQADELGGGGRFSIFGQNVVGRAEFQPGGWEAAYGGANGSLLRLGLSEGNPESTFVSLKGDLAGAELLYDGPSHLHDNTSMLVSARYYNFGPLFDLIDAKDAGTPQLVDLIIKTRTELSSGTDLSFLAVYTPETFTRDASNVVESPDFEDVTVLDTEQHAGVFGVTLDQLIGANGELRNAVYYRFADDDSSQGEAIPELTSGEITAQSLFVDEDIVRLRERESEFGWRLDYSLVNGLGQFSIGTRLTYLRTDYEQSVRRDYNLFDFGPADFRPDPNLFYITLTPETFDQVLDEGAVRAALYADQRIDIGSFSLTPGVRVDYDGLPGKAVVSPRFRAQWQASANTRYSATAGVYMQAPRLLEIAANPSNQQLLPERMLQFSLGWERYIGDELIMLVEGYYQDLEDLLTDRDQVTGLITNNGVGRTYGVDWSLLRRFSRGWSASARYSYINARRDFRDGQGEFEASFSRPHLANVTVNYEPNERWAFAAQYQIASGAPIDEFIIRNNVLGDDDLPRSSRESIARNVDRLDTFQTFNVRVDYRRKLRGISLIAFVDVVNVLGRENRSSLQFSPITGRAIDSSFGAFPQLGITVEF